MAATAWEETSKWLFLKGIGVFTNLKVSAVNHLFSE